MNRIHKIQGLRLLQERFPSISVDCLFVYRNHVPNDFELIPCVGRIWHVRSGRTTGTELNLPQGIFHSPGDVREFIRATRRQDERLEFVVHRIDDAYFSPIYLGTLALFDYPHPLIYIEFQSAIQNKMKSINPGISPRDWSVALSYQYDFLSMSPNVHIFDKSINIEMFKEQLYHIWNVGWQLYEMTHENTSFIESLGRFNIYSSGALLFDDFRSVKSFSPTITTPKDWESI